MPTPAFTTYVLSLGDGVPMYVGFTRSSLRKRMHAHRHCARSGHTTPIYAWMREVGVENVVIEEVEVTESRDLGEASEIRWIEHLRSRGYALLNMTDGGLHNDMTGFHTDEGRERIRQSMLGNTRTLGWEPSDETRALWSAQRMGNPNGSVAAHVRWHVNRGLISEACSHCVEEAAS
jgi:hypothetical protein